MPRSRSSTRAAQLAEATPIPDAPAAAEPAAEEPAAKRSKTEPHLGALVGQALPAVTLKNQDDEEVDLGSTSGILALFAYPKASTPGCTRQTRGFGEIFEKLEALEATVFGISADSPKAQKTFQTSLSLPFNLLSDPAYEFLEPFNAKKKPKGVVRSHWVFKDGVCVFAAKSVNADASPKAVLEFIEGLSGDDGDEASGEPEETNGETEEANGDDEKTNGAAEAAAPAETKTEEHGAAEAAEPAAAEPAADEPAAPVPAADEPAAAEPAAPEPTDPLVAAEPASPAGKIEEATEVTAEPAADDAVEPAEPILSTGPVV